MGERQVLTAAHCVCGVSSEEKDWFYPDGETCKATLADVEVSAFFPTAGVFQSVGPPVVHRSYIHAAKAASAGRDRIADLAIVELATSPNLPVLLLGEATLGKRHVLASYGTLSLSMALPGFPLTAGDTYRPGLAQLAINPRLARGLSCGGNMLKDVFCTRYDTFADTVGDQLDFAVCGGDSGAPILEVEGGTAKLIGITSFFETKGANNCRPDQGGISFYVDVEAYRPWIAEHAKPAVAVEAPRCIEAILVGERNYTIAFEVESVSVSTTDYMAADRYPAFAIRGEEGGSCTIELAAGFGSCRFGRAGPVEVDLPGNGIAQLVACSPKL